MYQHFPLKRAAAGGLILTLLAFPLSGLAAWPVVDWANLGAAAQRLARLNEQINHQIQFYRKQLEQYTTQVNQLTEAKNTLIHLKKQAEYLTNLERYRAEALAIHTPLVRSTYALTQGWGDALRARGDPSGAYARATVPYQQYPAAVLARQTPSAQAAIQRQTGDIEIIDAEVLRMLALHGDNTVTRAQIQAALGALERDSLARDPDQNSQNALLNKINAATLVTARTTQQTNQILEPLLHAQALQLKMQRDQQAAEHNARLQFVTDYDPVAQRLVRGNNDAYRRMNLADYAGR